MDLKQKDKAALADIRQRLAKMFAPDIRFTWDDTIRMYKMTWITDAGQLWMRKEFLIKNHDAKVSALILDQTMKLAGASGLCYEIVETKKHEKEILNS